VESDLYDFVLDGFVEEIDHVQRYLQRLRGQHHVRVFYRYLLQSFYAGLRQLYKVHGVDHGFTQALHATVVHHCANDIRGDVHQVRK